MVTLFIQVRMIKVISTLETLRLSASGQQTTFDIPIPTVTGEDPNRLSLVADEVIVKERLLVEGTSKQILSQFDVSCYIQRKC